MLRFTCEYIKSRRAVLTVPGDVSLILKIGQQLNINRLEDSLTVAAFIHELNVEFGSALIVPESFIEILAQKASQEILDALRDDGKLESLVHFVIAGLDELSP